MLSLPIVPFIDLANAIIAAMASVLLYRAYQRDPGSRVLYFFAQGYLAVFVSYLFFSIPRIFLWEDAMSIAVGFVAAQAFLYLAVAFFSKVSLFFINPQRMQLVFWLVIALSVVGVLLSIVYMGEPSYDPDTSITHWDIHPTVSLASIIIFGGVLLFNMGFFFWQGLRSQHQLVKIRSLIIAGGLFFLLITAYTYYEAISPPGILISDLFSLVSYLIIFFGIIYGRSSARRDTDLPKRPYDYQ